jgi:hypothetical protein
MSVTIKVNGTTTSLAHKFSSGITTATIPDVCKTPSPGGPVPVPYPNIANSITLSDGTTTVKGDKAMAANKGSKFSLSNGDNAGVAGGVKSSTFMKEATWILYSFDVKMDGKNVCRLTDKMFHNSENAANLGGEIQIPVLAGETAADLQEIAEKCNDAVNESQGYTKANPPKGTICKQMGTDKHACCEESINNYNKANPGSKLRSEVAFNAQGQALEGVASTAKAQASKVYETSKALVGSRMVSAWGDVYMNALKQAGGVGNFIADVLVLKDPSLPISKDNIADAFDFKFNCAGDGKMDSGQQKDYKRFTGVGEPGVIHSRWGAAGKVVSSFARMPPLVP